MERNIYPKKTIIIGILQLSLILSCTQLFAQNSLIGDGFGGRSWYVAHNYQVGSYTGFTVCDADSQLYAWGGNLLGELGNGTTISTDTPMAVPGMNHVKFYTTGYMCAVIKNDNTLWVWGVESSPYGGPLSGFTNSPQYVMSNVKFVDCAMNHAVIVKNDGTVWGIGQNTDGQLGNGSISTSSNPFTTPVQMLGINNAVRAIAVGNSGGGFARIPASIILLNDGTVKITGGYESFTDVLTYVPITIPSLHGIIDIKGCSNSAFALNNIGEVFAFGTNSDLAPGCLGLGTSVGINAYNPPTKITFPSAAAPIVALSSNCDGDFSFALDENQNVYAWGDNRLGQLGNGTMTSDVYSPQFVATNVIDIFAGETFSYILKSDNTLWCSGGSGYNSTYGSIWMNLISVPRSTFTQIAPTTPPMNLCAPTIFGTLPVKIIVFTCTAVGNRVSLNWRSGEESNFNKYIVQYSFDGTHFWDDGSVAAKGSNNNYAYYLQQKNIVTFYRLKLVDNDGRFNYSEIHLIKINATNTFSIAPNPADENIYLNSKTNIAINQVEVFSANGQKLKTLNNISSNQPINISSLAKGFYVLKITYANKNEFVRFVKR